MFNFSTKVKNSGEQYGLGGEVEAKLWMISV